MIIHAAADLPGDNDPALDSGPILVRVDIRISGDVPGGPGLLTMPSDGRRVAFLQARAERITDSARLVGRMWRRRVQDAEGRPWLIGVSGLKGRRGYDSPDTVRELAAIPGALDTCRLLAARLMAACIVGGVRGPASCDSDDLGYSYSSGRVRGQDPALPPGEPTTPRPVTPEDVTTFVAALPALAEDADADAELAALQAQLPGLHDPITPPTEIVDEVDEAPHRPAWEVARDLVDCPQCEAPAGHNCIGAYDDDSPGELEDEVCPERLDAASFELGG